MVTNTATTGTATTINPDGPAFPIPLNVHDIWDAERSGSPNGITVRDYFAAAALTGLLENCVSVSEFEAIASKAWIMAGWMLEGRNV